MNYIKGILLSIFKKPSAYLFVFLIIFSVDRYNRWVNFDDGKFPFVFDVDQYYSYLNAAFIHHDLSFSFPNDYWSVNLPNGNHIPKVTMGMAFMYTPFFLLGHLIASLSDYPADGYSLPYKLCVHFGSIIYSLLGLWVCRKNLLLFFNEIVTFITLICIFLGTNLFYYTFGFGEMPHAYLFFLFSLFIFFSFKWIKGGQFTHLLGLSLTAGLVTLIRPTDCLILLFPLFAKVQDPGSFRQRLALLFSYRWSLFLAGGLFLFPFFLQMLYWKTYSGQWLFFSYGDQERFFFNDPQIVNFLFGFRKGWLVYTPIMFFALFGIPFIRKYDKGLFYFIIAYLAITVYVLSSWWDWTFGGSFGCRALIQHYAFLAFPFAALAAWIFDLFGRKMILRSAVRALTCVVFYLLISLNFKQSWQYKYGIISYNGMTRDAYFYILKQDSFGPKQFEELGKKLDIPKREYMLKGKRDL
jgi:hypothetical protein